MSKLAPLAVSLVSCAACAQSVNVQVVAATGAPAPGVAGVFERTADVFFPSYAWINSQGAVVFNWRLRQGAGVDATNDSGVWAGQPGALELVAREGDPAPGAQGAVFGSLLNVADLNNSFYFVMQPVLAESGSLVFNGLLRHGAGVDEHNDSGLWWWTNGAGALAAREGDAAPGGGEWNDVGGVLFAHRAGRLVVAASATVNGTFRAGLWSFSSPGSGSLLLTGGDSAPGTTGEFAWFAGSSLCDGDRTIVHAALTVGIGGVTLNSHQGYWEIDGGTTSLVVRTGDSAPQTAGAFISTTGFGLSVTEDADSTRTLESGLTDSNGMPLQDFRALWTSNGGGFTLAARQGSPAPGAGGATFEQINHAVVANNDNYAFTGSLELDAGIDESNTNGIWASRNGQPLELIVRGGDPAPGAGGGRFLQFGPIALNSDGVMVFHATLNPQDVGTNFDSGLWYAMPDGTIVPALREGDQIDVGDGVGADVRTVRGILFFGGSSAAGGQPTSFNDVNQGVVTVDFADQSQAILRVSLVAPCIGDANGDNIVNFADLNAVLAFFGQTGAVGGADLNHDGVVNFSDLNTVLSAFGADCR